MSDISLFDPGNSSTTPLGVGGVFTGVFTDVTDYSSVSIMVAANTASAANGLVFQWSEDGVTLDDEQRYSYASFASEQAKVAFATVRARFFRIKYTNGGSAQTFFRLQTLLRRGTPQGSIGSAGIAITQEYDAVTTNSVLVSPLLASPSTLVFPRSSGDPYLYVEHPPNTTTAISEKTVIASTVISQALDFFGIFGPTRHWFTVYNDTIRGSLYIRLSGAASLATYFWKVPPRHTWQLPYAWRNTSAGINGIWDVADGVARTVELF